MAPEFPWHQYATLFRRLYIDENKTLRQVKSEVEEVHGFPINSLSVYETKLREVLGLRKNLTPQGWLAIGQRIKSNENREWEVYIHGRKIAKRKVVKEISRYARRESSSRNLPMAQEARIIWTDESSSRSQDRSIAGRFPQQRLLTTLSDSVLTHSRNEDLGIVDYDFMLTARSPSDVLHETELLRYNRPGIIDQTIHIAMAAKKYISTHFCAAILDHRLKGLWSPILNDLPFFSLTDALDHFRVRLGASMVSILQTTHTQDASATQSTNSSHEANFEEITNRGDTANDADHVHGLPIKGTVSTGFDPFQILGLVIYYLSNHFGDLELVEETMRFLMEKVSLNFVGHFLRFRSPAVEESWIQFAEWSFELGEKKFFEQVMHVSLSYPEWVLLHGTRCLAFAANLGCTQVVRTIIKCGVSPNKVSKFRIHSKQNGATPVFSRLAAVELHRSRGLSRGPEGEVKTVTTCPLLEAVLSGRTDTIEILKDAHADCQLRLDGLTTAGHVIIAHQHGLIDEDDLQLTLLFLMSMGENVDAPMIQHELGFFSDVSSGIYSEELSICSDETLLDAMYLVIGNSYLFKEFQERSQTPPGVLTVSGILRFADIGQDALRHHMSIARYPSGLPRKRIEQIAVARSLQLPKAFESMMKVGIPLKFTALKSLESRLLGDWSADKSLNRVFGRNDRSNFLLHKLATRPVLVQQYIVDQLTEDEMFRPYQMDGPDVMALVTRLSPSLLQRYGTKLLTLAATADQYNAVEACLKDGASPQEIGILELVHESGNTNQTILVLLYDHGARLSVSPYDRESKGLKEFSTRMLRWLMSHLSEFDGKKTSDIVAQFLVTEVHWKNSTDFRKWLTDFNRHEVFHYRCEHFFNSKEAKTYKDYTDTLLALLLCLGGSMKPILVLCLDRGLDLNSQQIIFPSRKITKIEENYNSKCASEMETAVKQCNIPMLQTLLDRGYNINYCDAKGRTVLEIAVESYVREFANVRDSKEAIVLNQLIIMLLENGANPNVEHHKAFETTASPSLVRAVKSEKPDLQLIQLLLKKGARADTDERFEKYGPQTLLSCVMRDEKKDLQLKKQIFAMLLASGAQYDEYVELYSACRSGDIELVRFHLDNGADPNKPKEYSNGPLEASASAGNISVALMLLAAGATLSGCDHSLSMAAEKGRLDMVSLLLPYEKRLKEVETALARAEKGCFYSIIRLLRQAKASWKA